MKTHITRVLRKKQTPWEVKIWGFLRNRGINGMKFRRQFKIGPYVADFCCQTSKLIVELDGGHHNNNKQKIFDMTRQRYLESQGYKVLRFWNREVDNNLGGVIEEIVRYS